MRNFQQKLPCFFELILCAHDTGLPNVRYTNTIACAPKQFLQEIVTIVGTLASDIYLLNLLNK